MWLEVWAAGDYMYVSFATRQVKSIHKKQHSLDVFSLFFMVLWPGGKIDMLMIPSSPGLLAYQLSLLHSESPFMDLHLFI